MARTEARIKTSIWDDPDFLALDGDAQRMYLFLLSQPDLLHPGLLPLRARKWARKLGTVAAVTGALNTLSAARFVVVDEDTEEVLIRTFVRNDGVYKQPKVMLRMREEARQIESPALREAFLVELGRLPLDTMSSVSARATAEDVIEAIREAFESPKAGVSDTPAEGYGPGESAPPDTDPSGTGETAGEYPYGRVSGTVSDTPRVRAGAFPHPPTPIPLPPETSEVADAPPDTPRTDVEGLCTLLADLIEANGVKRPRVTKRWRDAARLLLDRDGYTVEQVQWMARWATSHEFWRANVLSMPTLREKFDQLKLQAMAGRSKSDRRSPAEDAAATVALGERMQAEQDRRLLEGA